jgi:hypothetical protein
MIIVKQVSYAFLQIGVFNDRAESIPTCSQFRMDSSMYNSFAEFIKKNVQYANHIRDTYHDDAGSKSKYSMGNVDSFITYDRIPIVLVTLPTFLQFHLVIGTDVLTVDATDLEEIANQLVKLK